MAISHIFTNPVPDGTITSIVRPSDWNSAHNQYYTLSGNVLGASTVSGTNVVLQAGTNISLSGTGQTIVIQGTNTPQPTSYVSNVNGISGQVSLNAGSSLSASTNGSSITFGLASNITTALQSANSNYLTTQSVQTQPSGAIAGTGFTSTTTAGTAVTGALGTNGINLGIPAYLTTARASNDGVGLNTAQTNVTWTVNSGGISLNAGAYLTTARASNDGVGLNTAQTNVTWTVNSGGISLNAGAYLTTQTVQTQASGNIARTGFTSTTTTGTAIVGTLDTNGLNLGVPAFITAGGGGGNFSGGVSNLGNTAGSTGITGTRIVFVGTNNISLSQSTDVNGATISINQTGGGGGGIAAAAGGQTATSGTVNFANSNGITFGMSQSSQITASYTVPSMQVNLSGNTAGNSTASGNTLNFSGINVTLSGTNNSQIAISAPATSGITAGNNISLSSNGSTIGVSAQAVALGASTQTATSGTVNFANSNGISFGMSGSNQITASYTVPTQSVQTQASGNIVGSGFTSTTTTGTAVVGTLNSSGLSLGVPAFITAGGGGGNFSGGVSNLGNTAGSTGITGTRIVFVGTNNISLSQSTDANGATISINQTGNNFSAGISSLGNTNTVLSSGITGTRLVFAAYNNITLGQLNDTAGATISIIGANLYTLSGYNHYNDVVQSIGPVGQGSLIFDHIDLENAVQFDRFGLMIYNSNATNSTGSHTVSFWVGLYTQNGSTISRLSSTSTSIVATQSGTVGSYSLYSGIRQLTIPFTTTLTQGEYYLAAVSSSSSAGANGTYSQLLRSNLNSDYRGLWGSAVNATNQVFPGIGYYSANTAGLPVSVAFSEIRGTVANAFRPPVIIFQSGTF